MHLIYGIIVTAIIPYAVLQGEHDDYDYYYYNNETDDDPCDGGATVTGSSGVIASPNYLDMYPNLLSCEWTIQGPANTRIAVKFNQSFAVEADRAGNCNDSLSFSGDSVPNQPLCGTSPPSSFLLNSNEVILNFRTNDRVGVIGFSLTWTAVDPSNIPAPVQDTVTSLQGTIASPNHPNNYPNLADYSWLLQMPAGKYIVLEFDSLDIEATDSGFCPYDGLTISESNSNDPAGAETFCGPTFPLLFQTNKLTLGFKSDVSITRPGFSLRYRAVDPITCSEAETVTGTSGTITSPYYPAPCTDNLNCVWHIVAPEGKLVVIRFNETFAVFDDPYCTKEYVQVFDGSRTSSPQYLKNFCGIGAPRGFLSSSNEVTVVFVSQTGPHGGGFSISWETEDACENEQFRCWSGTCIAPEKQCNGLVDCPDDNADEAACFQGLVSNACGIQSIAPVFKWDVRIVGGIEVQQGSWPWQANLRYIENGVEKYQCGGSLIADQWVLTAAHCILKQYQWVAYLGDHNLTDFDVEKEQRIPIDGIYVHPDYAIGSGGVLINDIALMHLASPVRRTSWVQPVCLPSDSDAYPATGGDAIVIGWGDRSLGDDRKVEIMRQVRRRYVSEAECDKAFKEVHGFNAPEGLLCLGTDSWGLSACQGDSGGPLLQLVDGRWTVIGIVSFGQGCGLSADSTDWYTWVSRYVPYIQQYLDGPPPKETELVVLEEATGTLSFPSPTEDSYPLYPQNVFRQWFIEAPENKRITVRFDDSFDIEYGTSSCSFDYISIYDGHDTGAPLYRSRKMCGTLAPPDFESSTNGLVIEFSSDFSFQRTGFSFTWTTNDDCSPQEFRCWDRSCIESSRKCDQIMDCPDNSDEIQCELAPRNSFDCGKAEVAPVFPWFPLVVGGYDATNGAWPWQVALFEKSTDNFVCGATLISEVYIMTAAHCIEKNTAYQVTVGDFDLSQTDEHEKLVDVFSATRHPDYVQSQYKFDVALLELKERVTISKWVKTICRPDQGETNPTVGSTCILTGWGLTYMSEDAGSKILQQVQLEILSAEECRENLEDMFEGGVLPDHLICAGHKHKRSNACLRDSGGPLQCLVGGSWKQYGIVSFGSTCGDHILFERVSYYRSWMDTIDTCPPLVVQEGVSGEVEPPTVGGKYLSNLNCSWLLRGPPNMLLVIKFEYFDVESYSKCDYDRLVIYDGSSTKSRMYLDKSICGKNRTIPGFESTSNEVLVTFLSDSSVNFQGFKIVWTAVADCDRSTEFRCWDGTCIDQELTCDQHSDCPDNRDEIECSRQYGSCGRQDIAPNFEWSPRIVGGMLAVNGSWPWQAYIAAFGTFLCGGSIIDTKWILTAAHCIVSEDLDVGVGAYELPDSHPTIGVTPTIPVKKVHVHEKYRPGFSHLGYDIALLELSSHIVYDTHIQPACVASTGDAHLPQVDQDCVITGWGNTRDGGPTSNILRQARVPVLDPQFCAKTLEEYNNDIMFCAAYYDTGGIDACQGDSGGPLVCYVNNTPYQFGVVSFGNGCAAPMQPGYYTRLSSFDDWIRNITGELPTNAPSTNAESSTQPTTEAPPTVPTITEAPPTATEAPPTATEVPTTAPNATSYRSSPRTTSPQQSTTSASTRISLFSFNLVFLFILQFLLGSYFLPYRY